VHSSSYRRRNRDRKAKAARAEKLKDAEQEATGHVVEEEVNK
jgi:hypothetical protein